MHEHLDRAVVDLKLTFDKLCHKAAQDECSRMSTLDEPVPVLAYVSSRRSDPVPRYL